ncbi:MAG: VCBS repeat-containing protein, partial [Planctomycetales bacterium]|nr:VCBS repeat-containing protein [Planctomycetales bacterium]
MSNDGQGRFSLRAAKLMPAALPYSLAAADYDVDGDLDIYVCCYNPRQGVNRHILFARPVPYHDANNGGPNVLLQNDAAPSQGDWQFSYATERAGLYDNNQRFSYAAAWEDYDNDGDLDLYVANDFGRNNLYRNDGGRFHDVSAAAGVEDIGPGMSCCWGDYDNDGWMDLYVSNMFSSAGNRISEHQQFHETADAATREAFRRHARGNSLFANRQAGKFADVSIEAGVVLGRWAWGSRFADLNNDGRQDLIATNGFITQDDTGDL